MNRRLNALACLFMPLCFMLLSEAATVTGTLTYSKTVYSSTGTTSTSTTALQGATVTATGGTSGTSYTATTGSDGSYSLDTGSDTSWSVIVQSSGSGVIVGSDFSSSAITGVFSTSLTSGFSTSTTISSTITGDNTAPFNIFVQLVKGVSWLTSQSLSTTRTVNCVYSSSQGTQFKPTEFYLIIQNTSTDPDGFDDDIILHEFGHWIAEELSKDSSNGGAHSITQKIDLRLSWSEGLAHYLSSAIRGSSAHQDFSTSGVNSFDIASPGTAKGSEVELAVANALWQASNNGSNHSTVLSALTSFKSSLSTKSFASDPISMDTFYDMWSGSSLATIYSGLGMSYNTDDLASNTSSSPSSISNTVNFSKSSLTFFSDGDKDYFSFPGVSGDVFAISTSDTTNGALTSLKIYKGSVGASTLVSSNDQASGLSTDTTSSMTLNISDAATYIAEVSRFNSTTQNFGLGSNDGYSKTVGRYGGYTFNLNQSTFGSGGGTSTTTLSSSTTVSEGSSVLQNLINTNGSTSFTSLADFTNTVSSSGEEKVFTATDTTVTTKMVASSNTTLSHSDSAFSASLESLPDGHTVVFGTFPTSTVSNLPSGATGKVMSFDMKNGSTTVSSGFSVKLRLSGLYNANKTQSLYRQGSDGTFSDSGFSVSNENSDLLFTMTSFSVYTLVESDASSSSDDSSSSSATSDGGSGGGCLMNTLLIDP